MHIHIKIILPNVTSYVMALKTKKVWYVRLIFCLERVKKKCDGVCSTLNLKLRVEQKLQKWYKNWLFKSS